MVRHIGIRPRVKTADKGGKERPTEVCILDNGAEILCKLSDERMEMLFLFGRFPVRFEPPPADLDLENIPDPFIEYKGVKKDEEVEQRLVRYVAGKKCRIAGVACEFDGISEGDTIAIAAGGLPGNMLAFAAAREAAKVGAKVLRLNTSILKERRGEAKREEDHRLLARLVRDKPGIFHTTRQAERDLIRLYVLNDERIDAMKARIAVEQRAARAERSTIYVVAGAEELLELHAHDERRAGNHNLKAIKAEEERAESELERFIVKMDLYKAVFKPVPGMGPLAAARIIAAVGDIRRFVVEADADEMQALYEESEARKRAGNFKEHQHLIRESVEPNLLFRVRRIAQECLRIGLREDAQHLFAAAEAEQKRARLRRAAKELTINKLLRYVGLHVQPDGTFPRRITGKPAPWSGDARQGFYVFGDLQLRGYQAKSDWGQYLKTMKDHFRQCHPEMQKAEKGSLRYGEGHIANMALWRTLTRFAKRAIFAQWLDHYRREGLI